MEHRGCTRSWLHGGPSCQRLRTMGIEFIEFIEFVGSVELVESIEFVEFIETGGS